MPFLKEICTKSYSHRPDAFRVFPRQITDQDIRDRVNYWPYLMKIEVCS